MDWTESLRHAIDYIEEHILDNINSEDIANSVYMSPFYFQKGFKIMTGYTVGEYIKCRRLYIAALNLIEGNLKVIDAAYKYGYSTPESFTKAFVKFHGISPVQLKKNVRKINVFLPLKITISVKGGKNMNYVIETMDKIKLIGIEKSVLFEEAYEKIPKFWKEFWNNYKEKCENEKIGEFGVSIIDKDNVKSFNYMIAGRYNGETVPSEMKLFEIPSMSWARFKCFGPMPMSLQSVNTKIFSEWLPGNPDYEIAAEISIEWYSFKDPSANGYECEIWVPVKNKKN